MLSKMIGPGISRLAGASPVVLLVNMWMLQLYWLTGLAQFSSSPVEVAHATLGIVLTTFVLGHSFRAGFLGKARFVATLSIGLIAIDAALSLAILTIVACVLSIFFLLTTLNLGLVIGSIIITSTLAEMTRARTRLSRPALTRFVYPGIVIAFGILVAFIFRQSFAWPSMPGWDTYVHLADVSWIQGHAGSNNLFPTGGSSLLPYPLVFHVQVASLSDILGVSPYTIFWLAPFYLIPIYGLVVYGLSSVLTRNRVQSVFAGLIASSISGGEVLLGPQYLFPSTVFIVIFLLSVIAIVESPLTGASQLVFSSILLAVTFVVYYFPLFLAPVPLLALMIKRNPDSILARRRVMLLLVSVTATLLLGIVGSMILPIAPLSLSIQYRILTSAYPDALWLLIILGSFVVISKFSKNTMGYFVEATIVLFVGMLVLLYFLPISGSARSELMLRPFAAIVASYSFPLVSAALSRATPTISWFERGPDRLLEKASSLSKISMILFIALSTSFVVQPYISYGQHVPYWSNISSDEYLAAQWLSENSPPGGYILTDPSTGMMLRGLTLLNASTSFIIDGRTPSPQRYISTATSFPGFKKFNSSLFVPVVSWDTVRVYRLA